MGSHESVSIKKLGLVAKPKGASDRSPARAMIAEEQESEAQRMLQNPRVVPSKVRKNSIHIPFRAYSLDPHSPMDAGSVNPEWTESYYRRVKQDGE
jgi:hypothetical protein